MPPKAFDVLPSRLVSLRAVVIVSREPWSAATATQKSWFWETEDGRRWLTRLVEVGAGEARPDVPTLEPPRIPRRDALLQDLEMLRVRHRSRLPL
jgi:hypothetical protein